jgi:hypothetical protein
MRGGWRERKIRADYLNAGIGLGAAVASAVAAGVGVMLYNKRKQDESPPVAARSRGLFHAIFS